MSAGMQLVDLSSKHSTSKHSASKPTVSSSLLNDSNHCPSYNDEISQSKFAKSRDNKHQNINKNRSNNLPLTHSQRNKCRICIGRLLIKFKPFTKCISSTYHVLLLNAVIVCILLIVSRIYDNKLWRSDIFQSDSAPLLLTANIIMMISYSIENFLLLRICIAIGCLCFAVWALTSDPLLLDTTMFNTVMFLFNARHAVILSYHHRHIIFDESWEQIYIAVFEGYLNRVDFKKLVDISCKRDIKKGEIFKRKGDEVTSLCCLVNGRMSVIREFQSTYIANDVSTKINKSEEYKKFDDTEKISRNYTNFIHAANQDDDIDTFLQNPQFVNLLHKNHFIEAPQWVAANLKPDGDRFTVSFKAVDDCQYIKWPKEPIIDLIEADSNIYHALNGILGLHTARVLLKSREYQKYKALSIHEAVRKNTMNTQQQQMKKEEDTKIDINEKEQDMNINDIVYV